MRKKFLIVAHYSRFLVQFEMNNVKILQDMGYEVHYATNYQQEDMYADAPQRIRNAGVILHQIDFVRSPYLVSANIKAYRQLKDLMKEERFDGVHCHTPMAGVLARLAANATHTRPVFYTAHGFHFYKGCPIKNKLIYETAERIMAPYTDALITINEEDYQAAKTFSLRGKAYKISGVGVDMEKIENIQVDRAEKRRELGIPEDSFVMISVGELNENKNHITTIRAFIKANIPNSYYIICGEGHLKSFLHEQIDKTSMSKRIKLLGFRDDIAELLKISDLFLFPSKREGLGLAPIEALAAGLPVIAAKNRGSKEYADVCNVDLCECCDIECFKNLMNQCYRDFLNTELKDENVRPEGIQAFDSKQVTRCMAMIYNEVM